MVDDATDALYTVNRITGRAERVRSSTTRFGLSVQNALPTGLAWDGKYLLMLTPSTLYKLNTTSGQATRFVDDDIPAPSGVRPNPFYHPNTFGTNIFNATGLAAHDRRLFMVDATRDALYVLDRSRGAASKINNLTTSGGASIANPSGLAVVNTELNVSGVDLYVSSTNPNALYKINRSTGAATWSKMLSLDTITGIAWDGSTMYAVDDATDALYTIPGITAPAWTTPARSFLPNEGDLYYNGDVIRSRPLYEQSYTFVDSVMRWNNPHWQRPDGQGTPCNSAITNCSTYEHDLYISKDWVRLGSCITWSTLPNAYNDCETAGISDDEYYVVSFGTYKAPAIQQNEVYYGLWMLSSIQSTRIVRNTTGQIKLYGQEGAFRPLLGDWASNLAELAACPVVHETPWCVFGLGTPQILIPSNASNSITWNRGTPAYTTFSRGFYP